LETQIPRSVAASTSTLSKPVPNRLIIFRSGSWSSTAAVIFAYWTRIAVAPEAAATTSASSRLWCRSTRAPDWASTVDSISKSAYSESVMQTRGVALVIVESSARDPGGEETTVDDDVGAGDEAPASADQEGRRPDEFIGAPESLRGRTREHSGAARCALEAIPIERSDDDARDERVDANP